MLIFEKLLYFYMITTFNSVHHQPPMSQRFFLHQITTVNYCKVNRSYVVRGMHFSIHCNNLATLGRDELALMARKRIQKDDLLAPEVVKQS